MLKELQSLTPEDFAFIVQPEFVTPKDVVQTKIQELYSAETVNIGASGIGGVKGSPTQHEEEKYWLQCVLLNPAIMSSIGLDSIIEPIGKEIAQIVLEGISNDDKYDKIEITFIRQVQEGIYWKKYKVNKCYTVPDLELTNLFSE